MSGSIALLGEDAQLVHLIRQSLLDLAVDARQQNLAENQQRRCGRNDEQDQERDENPRPHVAQKRPAMANRRGSLR